MTQADPSAAAATTTTTPAPAAGSSSLKLDGCARDQNEVAVTLVRLRQLEGATDVSLDHSTRGTDSNGATPAAAPAGGSGAADTGCGTTHGVANYSFQANVTFASTVPVQKPGSVPNRLGGGS